MDTKVSASLCGRGFQGRKDSSAGDRLHVRAQGWQEPSLFIMRTVDDSHLELVLSIRDSLGWWSKSWPDSPWKQPYPLWSGGPLEKPKRESFLKT